MISQKSGPSPMLAAASVAVVALPIAFFVGCGLNMVSWYGGELAVYGGLLLAVLWAGIAYVLADSLRSPAGPVVVVCLGGWFLSMLVLYPVCDRIEVARLQNEAITKARALGQGEIPPSCQVGLPYRAMPRTPLVCRAPFREVAKFYEARLDPSFIRTDGGVSVQFDNGTAGVLISPTEKGCEVDVW